MLGYCQQQWNRFEVSLISHYTFSHPGILTRHSALISDFYKWNLAVNNGGECAGLWPDNYVCIGV